MVLKLYLEVFIPRNSFDRALRAREVTFCSLSKCIVAYLDAVVVAFSVAFGTPGSWAALGVEFGVFPRMLSRSLHESSAVVEETAFKYWA